MTFTKKHVHTVQVFGPEIIMDKVGDSLSTIDVHISLKEISIYTKFVEVPIGGGYIPCSRYFGYMYNTSSILLTVFTFLSTVKDVWFVQ